MTLTHSVVQEAGAAALSVVRKTCSSTLPSISLARGAEHGQPQ